MAIKREISCINKPDRNSRYEPIRYIGGLEGGKRWRMSEEGAIEAIEKNEYSFFVNRGGNEVKVIVATRNGRKYLKTEEDNETTDNLLKLPECPNMIPVKK